MIAIDADKGQDKRKQRNDNKTSITFFTVIRCVRIHVVILLSFRVAL